MIPCRHMFMLWWEFSPLFTFFFSPNPGVGIPGDYIWVGGDLEHFSDFYVASGHSGFPFRSRDEAYDVDTPFQFSQGPFALVPVFFQHFALLSVYCFCYVLSGYEGPVHRHWPLDTDKPTGTEY